METLEQAAHKVTRKISGFLSTDATARQFGELLRRIDRGEVIGTEDARIVMRTLSELDHLHKRCRNRIERIDHAIAKCPAHVQEAYRQELERGLR
jgi:hypothetical protein